MAETLFIPKICKTFAIAKHQLKTTGEAICMFEAGITLYNSCRGFPGLHWEIVELSGLNYLKICY